MNNKEVAHLWANQSRESASGSHFSTAQHKSYARADLTTRLVSRVAGEVTNPDLRKPKPLKRYEPLPDYIQALPLRPLRPRSGAVNEPLRPNMELRPNEHLPEVSAMGQIRGVRRANNLDVPGCSATKCGVHWRDLRAQGKRRRILTPCAAGRLAALTTEINLTE